jgi:hypothetical protein
LLPKQSGRGFAAAREGFHAQISAESATDEFVNKIGFNAFPARQPK